VRTFNLDTSKEHDWSKDGTGEEADRNKMQTTEANKTHVAKSGDTLKKLAMKYYGDPGRTTEIYDANTAVLKSSAPDDPIKAGTSVTIPKAVEGGYFIDHKAADARATPRTAKTDAQVPQDYVWPGEEAADNKNGSKQGKTIVPAMLKDRPGTPFNLMFNFETVARSVDLGIYYGTIHWDFEVKGGKVSQEGYKVVPGVSETFKGALDEFNKFYKNKHVVMKGESLWKIAEHYYGDGKKWPDIHNANKDIIKDPDHIEPGWELNIPTMCAGV
jgi:nucleoid-associated protein YgaU